MFHQYFSEFRLCSWALQARVCRPQGDGISSTEDLLASIVLRVSVWAVAIVACAGNAGVLVGRAVLREPNPRHACYIQNLALADFFMGLYLVLIAAHDVAFRGNYLVHATAWRSSWRCGLAGFLCTLSSEASVLILSVITLDRWAQRIVLCLPRYASVVHPLSVQRRTRAAAGTHMALAWGLAAVLAGGPLATAGRQFYGHNGVCLPLHVHDPWGAGWQWSAAEFCGLNLAALVLVAGAYSRMFLRISGSQSGLRSTQQLQDRAVAQRFALIVATDFLCWLPIIIVKFVAMSGGYLWILQSYNTTDEGSRTTGVTDAYIADRGVRVDEDLYAWVAVFLLPVNSALNPVLYTLTTKLFKQRLARLVFTCRTDPAVISFSTLLRGHRFSDTAVPAAPIACLCNCGILVLKVLNNPIKKPLGKPFFLRKLNI
ncbi:GPRGPH [Cordylochernes scorpioides]|uniref:GPRGPH n=1 Tax=Cordylochernes scorpioides TaxID=51811 RepID=A0ABY6LQR3_9ARAC|nr:GPRGPH [Cordylochernes scorpioides]